MYRPPPSKANGFSTSFFQEWEDYFNHLVLLKQDILLTGDINFHQSSKTKHFNSTLDSFNFILHVDAAIHIGGHIIDIVPLLENSSLLYNKLVVCDTFIYNVISAKSSDHFAIICKLGFSFQSQKFCNIMYRNIQNIDLNELNKPSSI